MNVRRPAIGIVSKAERTGDANVRRARNAADRGTHAGVVGVLPGKIMRRVVRARDLGEPVGDITTLDA